MDFKYRNDYLQVPVMATFSVGGQKLRDAFKEQVETLLINAKKTA